jgi:hypothetical protein
VTEIKAFELSGNFRTFLLDFQYRTLPRTRHSIFLTRFILILRDANEISLQLPLLAESWRSSSSVVRWLGIWTRPIVLGSWVASELKIIIDAVYHEAGFTDLLGSRWVTGKQICWSRDFNVSEPKLGDFQQLKCILELYLVGTINRRRSETDLLTETDIYLSASWRNKTERLINNICDHTVFFCFSRIINKNAHLHQPPVVSFFSVVPAILSYISSYSSGSMTRVKDVKAGLSNGLSLSFTVLSFLDPVNSRTARLNERWNSSLTNA